MRPAEPEKREHALPSLRFPETESGSTGTPIVSWPASAFQKHRILIFKVGLRDPIDVPQPIGLAPSIRGALGESTRTGTFVSFDKAYLKWSRRLTAL
jgi:hypothetical protein